mgnify:FL=1
MLFRSQRDPGPPLKTNMTRRHLLKAAAVSLAALGMSATADAAMAASSLVKVGKVTDIPLKKARSYTLKGKYIIVTQPKKGMFKAFSGICTHQGQMIGGYQGSNLICRAHGSTFDTTTGNATGGPAMRSLTRYKLTNKKGVLYITL